MEITSTRAGITCKEENLITDYPTIIVVTAIHWPFVQLQEEHRIFKISLSGAQNYHNLDEKGSDE